MVLLYRSYTRQNAAEGLLWIQDRVDQNADVVGGLAEVVAHLLAAEALRHDIEVETVILSRHSLAADSI